MAPTGGQRSGTENESGLKANLNSNITSDRQVAASNSTLNAWVGRGRRQPSWLANAKPAKPSPRPPPCPPPRPSKQPITTDTVRPSDETTQPVSVSVPTSNTPVTTPAPPRQPRRPQRPAEPVTIQTQTQIQSPQISTLVARTVLPSPAPSDEPSPGATKPQSVPTVIAPRLTLDTALDDDQQAQSRVSTPHLQPILQRSREVSVSPGMSIPANMSLNTPPTPNLSLATNNLPPLEHLENPPAKRQRTSHPSLQLFSVHGASIILNHRIQSIGGLENLDPVVERPRYQLLLDSCTTGDLFFIVLHQIFCIWSKNRAQAYELCKIDARNPKEMDQGFGNLEMILKSNTKLNPDHLNFFTQFPAPLNDLLCNPRYQAHIGQVLNFLCCMALNWQRAIEDRRKKGHPFLVRELLDGFLLSSNVLQGIMFRASRRSIGTGDGPMAKHMEMLFESDQEYHRNCPNDFSERPLRYQEHNTKLITSYKQIVCSIHQLRDCRVGQQPYPAGSSSMQQSNQYHFQNLQIGPQANSQIVSHTNQTGNQIATQYFPQVAQANYPVNPQIGLHMNTQLNHPVDPRVNTHMGYQINPQVQQNLYQAPQSPQTAGHTFTQGVITTTVPPSHILSSNSSGTNSPTVTTPSQPNPNYHVQHNAGGRPSQPNIYMAPISPQPTTPASVGGYNVHQVHPAGQRPQNLYGSSSQSNLVPPNRRSSVNQIPAYNNPNPAPVAPTTATHTRHPMNQLQGPNYIQTLPSPQPQNSPLTGYSRDLDRLIPAPGVVIERRDYPYAQHDNNSDLMSLHQVQLRSPKRMPREQDPEKLGRYYQAVKEFALLPVEITPQPYLHEFDFSIPEEQFIKMVKGEARQGEQLLVSLFSSGSLRLRIRCCYMKRVPCPLIETWVTTETVWPQHIFLELNNNALSVPRKSHFSKDLPVDASSMVVANKNVFKIWFPSTGQEKEELKRKPDWEFYIAVEFVEILSHRDVLRMVETHGRVPADATREVIRNRLLGAKGDAQNSGDEDELVMLDELSIDLIDPFSSVMFKVPVRGTKCTHLECFDLETWLNSRLGKKSCNRCNNAGCPKCPNEPSFVDKWRCPLCSGDARPYSLVVDEFLVEVRSQLERHNLLRTKSIHVSPDGTWKPKEQPADDDKDVDSDEGSNIPTKKLPKTQPRKESQIEVIEID
ncbi:hypothetical protein F5Y11DRAFT_120671 [Daldinia sp. FL1419]|nr:hypothetical protein F5Y11DRAFT_120671 [Daldinia sp. FL1419]